MSPRRLRSHIVVVAGLLVIALALSEGLVRVLGHTDASGQFYFRGTRIRPYVLPVDHVAALLEAYHDPSTTPYIGYDAAQGWSINPNATMRDGLYRSNADGLRADRDYALEPAPGVLRVALFGDSFTHADEVALADSWGYLLEQALNARGVPAEVLNFGVGAYGIDQAYLRWQEQGRAYQPDVVILGMVADDVYRNVNVLRALYVPWTGMPFSKPRFVLGDDGLTLVNSPTVPPAELLDFVQHFGESPQAAYEHFYRPQDYTAYWWTHSRLLAVGMGVVWGRTDPMAYETPGFFALEREPAQLALAISEAFRAEVEAEGAAFMLVHLPRWQDLAALRAGEPLMYAELLAALADAHPLVDAAPAFPPDPLDELFGENRHYQQTGNRVVSDVLLEPVLALAAEQ